MLLGLSSLRNFYIPQTIFDQYQVKKGDKNFRVYFKYLGSKGDWPWLRAAHKLATGYQCTRICHLCDAVEIWYPKFAFFFANHWVSTCFK